MNTMFVGILNRLIADQGKETILNPAKCKAFLADYTKGEYKKESRLLLQALDVGVQKAIDATEELEICKKQQARVLQEELFLFMEAAVDVVDTLTLILRKGQEKEASRGIFCANCGKELQKEWVVCPHCRTSVVKIQPEPPQTELQPSPAPVEQTPPPTSANMQTTSEPLLSPTPVTQVPSPTLAEPPKDKHTMGNVELVIFGILVLISVSIGIIYELSKSNQQPSNQLVVWSFTDELANMTNNRTWGFKATHPKIDVSYSQTPSDQLQAKIDPVLATGQGVPDIIALESAFVRKYVESGLLLDITDIYEANKGKLLAYPVEVGTYNGRVYAMSWQACPGAMFYRRSLARKYLGTDDPRTVQTYFTNFNKLLETARLLKDKSNGSCVVISSLGDLRNSFYYARTQSWNVNGKLVIDPAMEQYMDIGKTLHNNRFEGRVGQWSEGWFAGMRDELRDERRKPVEVFSYFLPTWGLHYVLKTNAPSTSGDWAMIQGPSSYRWGGTWVGAYKGTKNAAAAKEFIRYVATDEGFLEAWARDTGDMVSNTNVINKIKGSYSEPFLGGQNHYSEFAEIAKGVNGRLLQGSDEAIEAIFDEAAAAYWNGEKSKAQALNDFRAQVRREFSL